ncbi:MAG TPA: hypothetical protein VFB60_24670 [Ktedonobacteraceae bacterium]|nr:hypothetical protein [Ktedonobacteraceae bacterium]
MNESQPEPIQLQTPKSLLAKAKATMQQHGCLVEEGSVTLPPGSTRTLCERYLQTTTQWYDLVLPDQFRMLEAYEPQRHLSILYLPPQ